MSNAGHNSGDVLDNSQTVSAGQLRAFVERLERLDEDAKNLNDDRKEVYAEAKGSGFDTKVLREVLRIRRADQATREEFNSILELYLTALGME